MALPQDTRTLLIAFIKAHSDHLTVNDMVEELDYLKISYYHINDMCSKLGIVPITVKQQTKKFIVEYAPVKTLAQLAKSLGICDQYVLQLCKELNVKPLQKHENGQPDKQILPKGESPGQILSHFTMPGVPHYIPPPRTYSLTDVTK